MQLSSVCERITSGGTPSRKISEYFTGDIPWVKTQELLDRWIDDTDEHITPTAVANSSSKLLPANTVLMAMYGATVGQLGLLRRPMTCNQAAVALVVDPSLADFRYIYYQLLHSRQTLRSLANGAAQQNLSGRTVADFEVPVPPLAEQFAIGSVLGALDDKIESNRRLTATIDALLRAELENAILNEDNPREVRFGEIALRVGEASDPRNLQKHVPYIGLEHMPRGNMFLDEWGTSEGLGSGKSVFKEGNVLFGRLRPYFKKVGVAPIDGICSTDVLVLRPAFNESAAMLLALAASEEFIGYASAAATGTKMPRVSWDYLSDWKMVLPSEAATNRFDIDMSPLVAKAIDSVRERVALAKLRDALLPELLSGRLRVKDAESMMENV
jgi:type I restriction enzyme S subunit